MRVGIRAAWRLLRCVLHALHGMAIVIFRFERLDAARRHDYIRWWSSGILSRMGVGLKVEGDLQAGGVLLVSNHVSWLDINALHAVVPQARFVSKSDIQSWPLISRLADAANTLYLVRERKRDALRVGHLVAGALREGQKVAVFPEGTTSDGHTLLPFHANLIQSAISTGTPVQPIVLRFSDAEAFISPAVKFVGATTLVASMWQVACAEELVVHVSLLPALPSAGRERRAFARQLRDEIGAGLAGRQ